MNVTLTLDQAIDLIAAVGNKRTIVLQGAMGMGKTSIMRTLKRKFPDHYDVVIDGAQATDGDLYVPMPDITAGVMRWLPTERLGLHTNKRMLVNLDEIGKIRNQSILNGYLTLLFDRRVGDWMLPEGSIVFATTNLSSEGLGDFFMPHQRNRMILVTLRNHTNTQWCEWALEADIYPAVIRWVDENPMSFASFSDYPKPDAGKFTGYHPELTQEAFVTGRSLHAASDILHQAHLLDDDTVLAGVCGAVGEVAGRGIFALHNLLTTLPRTKDIIKDPSGTLVPDETTHQALVVYHLLQSAIIARDTTKHPEISGDANFISKAMPMFAYVDRLTEPNLKQLFITQLCKRVEGAASVLPPLVAFARNNLALMRQITAK